MSHTFAYAVVSRKLTTGYKFAADLKIGDKIVVQIDGEEGLREQAAILTSFKQNAYNQFEFEFDSVSRWQTGSDLCDGVEPIGNKMFVKMA